MNRYHTYLCLLLMILCGDASVLGAAGSDLWLTPLAEVNKARTPLEVAHAELTKALPQCRIALRVQSDLPAEGYRIQPQDGSNYLIIGGSEVACMYGAYDLIRRVRCTNKLPDSPVTDSPRCSLRMLNHWDNPDGTIERGYAGHSLWKWNELPTVVNPRYVQYARANASIGINATVLNNVNASPQILSASYLVKVQKLAEVFRPFGIRVFLSINFSSPAALGGLATSDPLDADVRRWWQQKVNEIYQLIPDFGGFLVKANSEGLPGPQDYGRTHVDGANLLADALAPHQGTVLWRTFVYSPIEPDRAKQAYDEFMPFDGKFRNNVILQVKNGPVDFQPREPLTPLFYTLKNTPLAAELQITQEYTGFSNHLCFLAPMWKECLDEPFSLRAIAGVANIGDEDNWCGHPFAQANWYAFGRLAWNSQLSSETIANEWLQQTFNLPEAPRQAVASMMLESREAVVDYMMPMGLHHLFAFGHHYGPEPWCDVPGARADWMPRYYHQADKNGIGFDRSSTGSNATSQYPDSLCHLYNDVSTCPENLLLWFHHLPWDYQMKSGNTLWQELCRHYQRGVEQTRKFQNVWKSVRKYVDLPIFQTVEQRLRVQTRDAEWWRDGCLLYFQECNGLPMPAFVESPLRPLKEIKQFKLRITNYECPPGGFYN